MDYETVLYSPLDNRCKTVNHSFDRSKRLEILEFYDRQSGLSEGSGRTSALTG